MSSEPTSGAWLEAYAWLEARADPRPGDPATRTSNIRTTTSTAGSENHKFGKQSSAALPYAVGTRWILATTIANDERGARDVGLVPYFRAHVVVGLPLWRKVRHNLRRASLRCQALASRTPNTHSHPPPYPKRRHHFEPYVMVVHKAERVRNHGSKEVGEIKFARPGHA